MSFRTAAAKCIIGDCSYYLATVHANTVLPTSGYGFVDFDSPAAALKAVHALKTSGIQAQMAKVSLVQAFVYVCIFVLLVNISMGLCFCSLCMCSVCVGK